MRSQRYRAALVLLLCAGAVAAQSSGGDFELRKHTIDAGGGRSTGGGFVLDGTIGQPDAGATGGLDGAGFHLDGGFWPDAPPPPQPDAVFADGFEGP